MWKPPILFWVISVFAQIHRNSIWVQLILIQYLKTLFPHLGFAPILFQTSKILMNFTKIHFFGFGSLRSRHNFCGFCSISLQCNQTQHLLLIFFTTNYPNKRYCLFDCVNTKSYFIEILTWPPCCFIRPRDVDQLVLKNLHIIMQYRIYIINSS